MVESLNGVVGSDVLPALYREARMGQYFRIALASRLLLAGLEGLLSD